MRFNCPECGAPVERETDAAGGWVLLDPPDARMIFAVVERRGRREAVGTELAQIRHRCRGRLNLGVIAGS